MNIDIESYNTTCKSYNAIHKVTIMISNADMFHFVNSFAQRTGAQGDDCDDFKKRFEPILWEALRKAGLRWSY